MTVAAAVAALMFALILGFSADRAGRYFGLMDWPDILGGRKLHQHPTPLIGGTATCVTAILSAIACAVAMAMRGEAGAADLAWFAATVSAMFFIGVADDRHTLSPRTRLAGSVGALLLILSAAPMFTLTELRFSADFALPLGALSMLFTLVCLVGLLNAVNMADGKNGLVITMSLIWCAVLASYASPALQPVLAALGASLAVMLVFNLRGKLFLGDGGSYGLSAAFGLLAIYIHKVDPVGLTADRVALLFVVPVLDTVRLMSIRMLRKTSPFAGDCDHFHHHLERRWGWPAGLFVYGGMVLLSNVAAEIAPGLALPILGATVLAYFGVLTLAHVPDVLVAAPEDNITAFPRSAIRRTFAQPVAMDEDAA